MVEAQKVYFRYSVLLRHEGKGFASWCPELDVASSGNSVELACKNLDDAVHCFVEAYSDLGELKEMLSQKGLALNNEGECHSWFMSEARIGVPTAA